MIRYYLSSNNKLCYSNFSSQNRETGPYYLNSFSCTSAMASFAYREGYRHQGSSIPLNSGAQIIRSKSCSSNQLIVHQHGLLCTSQGHSTGHSFGCTCKLFEKKSFHIWSIKYKLITKLITDSVRKQRDESNEYN